MGRPYTSMNPYRSVLIHKGTVLPSITKNLKPIVGMSLANVRTPIFRKQMLGLHIINVSTKQMQVRKQSFFLILSIFNELYCIKSKLYFRFNL